MKDKRLADIRQLLRNKSRSHLSDPDEVEDQLDLLMEVDEAGERKMADKMLTYLPEPEHKTVRDYRALNRVWEEKLYEVDSNLNTQVGATPEYHIKKALEEKRAEAMEIVRERIVVQNEPDGETPYLIKDPVSKQKLRIAITTLDERELDIERRKDQLANEVLHEHA